MRKYRAYDEVTRGPAGLYVAMGDEGGVDSVFVTHGPIGYRVSVETYLQRGYTPDFRSLPTRKKLEPQIEITG